MLAILEVSLLGAGMSMLFASVVAGGPGGRRSGHPVARFGKELAIVRDLEVGGTMAARVAGNRLYSVGGGSLRVFDISDPGNPRLVSTLRGIPQGRQIEIARGIAYVTARENGVFIVDLRDDESPKLLCHYDAIEVATGVDVSGDVLCVACRGHGVEMVDVTDPARPLHLGIARTGEAQSVVVKNGYAYTGVWGTKQLVAVDVRNPRRPRITRKCPLDGNGDGVAVRGRYVFVATGHHSKAAKNARPTPGDEGYGCGHGLEIFDISNPARPAFVSRIKTVPFYRIGMDMWGVKIAGDHAFVHDTYNGIFVVNIRDPKKPCFVAHRQLPYKERRGANLPIPVGNLALAKNHIYVCGAWSDLHVAAAPGLALPAAPEPDTPPGIPPYQPRRSNRFRIYKTDGQVRGAAFVGDVAVVASGADGIHVVQLWPEIKRLHRYETEGFAMGVETQGRLVAVAEDKAGLSIWRMEDDHSLVPVGRYRSGRRVVRQVFIPPRGKYAVLQVALSRLEIVDISEPSRPACVFSDGGHGFVTHITRQLPDGRYLYVNWQIHGIFRYDLYGGPKPRFVGKQYPHRVDGAALLLDDRLLVFHWRGIVPIGPSEQRRPENITPLRPGGKRPRGLPRLFASMVYLSGRATGDIAVLDVANPRAPRITEQFNVPGNPGSVTVHNGVLVIANGHEGLWVGDKKSMAPDSGMSRPCRARARPRDSCSILALPRIPREESSTSTKEHPSGRATIRGHTPTIRPLTPPNRFAYHSSEKEIRRSTAMNRDDPILKKCRAILSSLYGDRLKGVILYGSLARGTEREDSDIDLLVLLEGPVDAGLEIYRIWDVLYPVQLESDRIISVMPADAESYRRGDSMLYRNVQECGVPV